MYTIKRELNGIKVEITLTDTECREIHDIFERGCLVDDIIKYLGDNRYKPSAYWKLESIADYFEKHNDASYGSYWDNIEIAINNVVTKDEHPDGV